MIPQVVAEAARRFGDAVAYALAEDPATALTYRELDRLSGEVAAGFARRGVRAGDTVALVLPPSPIYPICYAAAARLGATTAGVNTRLGSSERQALLDLVAPRVVVAAPGMADTAGAEVVEVDWSRAPREALRGLRDGGAPPAPPPPDPDRAVAVVFTSGTTGAPRGAVFAERQLAAVTANDVGEAWGGGGRGLAATSFSHLGFLTKFPGALRRGGTTYILPEWDTAAALRLHAELRLDAVAGIPTQVALLLARPEVADFDLGSVRLVVMGGGPATPALVRAARATFAAPVVVKYSCTEAAIGTATLPSDPPEDAEETVGRPQPGVDLAIRSGDGEDLPPGEVGEVLLRSAAVMLGYLGDAEATRRAIAPDGFVRTGDLGYVDEGGRLRLVGRSRERYVRGGENVYPLEVESVLAGHPGVRDIAVVALPEDVMGEVGVACVVPADPAAPVSLDGLRAFGATRLAPFKLPERIVLVDALPLTAGDKVDRAALRARLVNDDRVR